jgi:hypothetical protein
MLSSCPHRHDILVFEFRPHQCMHFVQLALVLIVVSLRFHASSRSIVVTVRLNALTLLRPILLLQQCIFIRVQPVLFSYLSL